MTTPASGSAPHPWLTFIVGMLLSVGASLLTTAFAAGARDEAQRNLQQQVTTNTQAIAALNQRANVSDVTNGKIVTELAFIREDIKDMKNLLQGKTVRYARD